MDDRTRPNRGALRIKIFYGTKPGFRIHVSDQLQSMEKTAQWWSTTSGRWWTHDSLAYPACRLPRQIPPRGPISEIRLHLIAGLLLKRRPPLACIDLACRLAITGLDLLAHEVHCARSGYP